MSTATIAEAPPAPSLSRLLQPKSIAIIGASNRMPSIGGYVTANILRAFEGEIYPVNPREQQVQGRRAYASVEDLPEDVDLVAVLEEPDGTGQPDHARADHDHPCHGPSLPDAGRGRRGLARAAATTCWLGSGT